MTVTNFELFIKLHSLGVNAKILVAQGGEDGYGTSRQDGISGDYRKCKKILQIRLLSDSVLIKLMITEIKEENASLNPFLKARSSELLREDRRCSLASLQ